MAQVFGSEESLRLIKQGYVMKSALTGRLFRYDSVYSTGEKQIFAAMSVESCWRVQKGNLLVGEFTVHERPEKSTKKKEGDEIEGVEAVKYLLDGGILKDEDGDLIYLKGGVVYFWQTKTDQKYDSHPTLSALLEGSYKISSDIRHLSWEEALKYMLESDENIVTSDLGKNLFRMKRGIVQVFIEGNFWDTASMTTEELAAKSYLIKA